MHKMHDDAMDEAGFLRASEALFTHIGALLDQGDPPLDWDLGEHMLTLELPGGAQSVLSAHVPRREIWLATPSGAFHYAWCGVARGWQDTRVGTEAAPALDLPARLSQILRVYGYTDAAIFAALAVAGPGATGA